MSTWINLIIILAQEEPLDTDSALRKLLPLLIIMILYGLSSLLRGKKQKDRQPPARAPSKYKPIEKQETTRQQQLPSYARKATTRPQPTQPRPVQPRLAQQRPAPAPRPASPTRVPGAQPPRPGPPIRHPVPAQPRPVPTVARPAPTPLRPVKIQPRPAEQEQRTARRKAAAVAMAAVEAKKKKHEAQLAYKQKKIRDAAQTAKQLQRKVPQAHGMDFPVISSRDKLLRALQQPNEAARGIVYAEILGKPLALREKGSFEF